MTEIRNISEMNHINWRGFCFSLAAAPLVTCSSVFLPLWVLDRIFDSDEIRGLLAITAGISVVGSLIYLIVGTPTLIWHLRHHAPDVGQISILAFISLIWLIPMAAALALITRDLAAFYLLIFIGGFGAFLAPLWGAVFALFYKRFTRH